MRIKALFIAGVVCVAIAAGVVEALVTPRITEKKETEKEADRDKGPEDR